MSVKRVIAAATMLIALSVGHLPADASAQPADDKPGKPSCKNDWPWGNGPCHRR